MSHNTSISGMGKPMPAIRVINEKQMLLITVGINSLRAKSVLAGEKLIATFSIST